MRRLGRLMLWLLALVFLAATLVVTVEPTKQGVSWLLAWSQDLDRESLPEPLHAIANPLALLEIARLSHILLGTLAAWWVVILCFRNAARSGLRSALWIIPLATVFALQGLFTAMWDSSFALVYGWAGRLETLGLPDGSGQILLTLGSPLIQWSALLIFAYVAAAMTIARTRVDRRLALLVIGVGGFAGVTLARWWSTAPPNLIEFDLVSLVGLALLAFAAFLQSDGDEPGLPHIIVGAAGTLAAAVYLAAEAGTGLFDIQSRPTLTATPYLGPFAMVTFLAFAVLDIRWNPRVPRLTIWLHALGLSGLAALAFVPYTSDALASMPRRYTDYPEAFNQWQEIYFAIANAQLLLLAWVLCGIAFMYHYRDRPHPQAPHTTTASRQAA